MSLVQPRPASVVADLRVSRFPSRLFPVLLVLAGLFWLAMGGTDPLGAQEDLSVPGLTDNLPVEVGPPPGTVVGADGTVSKADTSLFGLIASGGWSMWILGLFSLAVIGLGIYCYLDLRPANFCPTRLTDQLGQEMATANLKAVAGMVKDDSTTLGRMMAAFAHEIEETGYSTDDNQLIRDLMMEAGIKHNRRRARVINYFSVLAQAAPMMGLLGTVSGMIKAFGTLGNRGMGDPGLLAANISEALVTTATGLVIALPAIFLYFFFRDRLEELITRCEDFGVEMLNQLRRAAYASVSDSGEETGGGRAIPAPDL